MSVQVLIGVGDLLRLPIFFGALILDALHLGELGLDAPLGDSLGLGLLLDHRLLGALRSLELLVLLLVRVGYSWHC